MARMRMLKPGFFTNDDLGKLPPLGRLLFAGLWCIADREGRLEDRPLRIRAEVLPYDPDADVDALLDGLVAECFIVRYRVEGRRYIQVVNFAKHQNPHVREPASTIPAPGEATPDTDEHCAEHLPSKVPAPDEHHAEHPPSRAETETETETVPELGTETELLDTTAWQYSLSPPAAAASAPPTPTSLEPRYSAEFEAWWEAYPRKREKVDAYAVYQKTRKAGATVDELLAASRNYATAVDEDGAEDKHIKLPATFLSLTTRPWLDFRTGVPRPERNGRRAIPAVNGRRESTRSQLDRVFGSLP